MTDLMTGDVAALAVDRVRALHQPEKRWQQHPDCEWSHKNRQDAVDELDDQSLGVSLTKPHAFTICSECGSIEEHDDQRDPGDYEFGYLYALWPCRTIRVLDGQP